MESANTFVDCLGHTLGIGASVVVLSAGNFIYGHVTGINEDGKVDVLPDIGYKTSKPNFRLKKLYKASPKHISLINVKEDDK